MGRILKVEDADEVARRHKAWGFELTTLHVGTGLETDADIDALVGAVLEAQARHGYPLYIETHRATVTQDMRRTLDLIDRFPTIRFNADLSHWYTGHEMTYGDIAAKFDALQPVFDRVRYMHGRIGDSSNAQTSIHDAEGRERPQVAHFRDMWTRCMDGFLRTSDETDCMMFAPELLPATAEFGGQIYTLNYARLSPDGREETDRWTEALGLCAIAAECYAAAELKGTR